MSNLSRAEALDLDQLTDDELAKLEKQARANVKRLRAAQAELEEGWRDSAVPAPLKTRKRLEWLRIREWGWGNLSSKVSIVRGQRFLAQVRQAEADRARIEADLAEINARLEAQGVGVGE